MIHNRGVSSHGRASAPKKSYQSDFERLGKGPDITTRAKDVFDFVRKHDNDPHFDTVSLEGTVKTGDRFDNVQAEAMFRGPGDNFTLSGLEFTKDDYKLTIHGFHERPSTYSKIEETRGDNPTEVAWVGDGDPTWEQLPEESLVESPPDNLSGMATMMAYAGHGRY